MATQSLMPAMSGDRTVHPFFARAHPHGDDYEVSSIDIAPNAEGEADHHKGDEVIKVKSSKQPKKSGVRQSDKTQKTLQEIINPSTSIEKEEVKPTETLASTTDNTSTIESSTPRKRRRTTIEESAESRIDGETPEDVPIFKDTDTTQRAESSQVIIPASSPVPSSTVMHNGESKKTPPKKMLRLNASGKFSSPISKNARDEDHLPEPSRRRGRPRKPKEVEQQKQLVAVIKYAAGEKTLGTKIDRILSGEERHASEMKPPTPKKPRPSRKQPLPKTTHPFFLSKPKESEFKQPSPRKASAVTPGKLRRQTMEARFPTMLSGPQVPDYVVGSSLLKDRLMLKHPGAREPAWPTRDQSHVRGLEHSDTRKMRAGLDLNASLNRRKRKTARMPFPIEESILRRFSENVQPEQDGEIRQDGFREPHPSLVLPNKLLIPGQELSRRIRSQLSTIPSKSSEDELANPNPSQHRLHPASQRLHDRLQTTLSAFDEGRGEPLSWTQKYGPIITTDVLQPSREMNVLRDWLTSLTVSAVVRVAKPDLKPLSKAELKPRKKRRRKADEMDDFLVSDDEEIRDMDELTDPEEKSPSSSANAKTTKSVIQIASDGVRLSNAVLLSGPHGCGKSAAAHAVAKELGFKVFEISPGERRSGKDVLDKVGDMTENHLVKHHGTDTAENSAAEEPTRIDEAFQRDLVSGRQGTMNAFFKPQAPKAMSTSADIPVKSDVKQKKHLLEAVHKAAKKPSKEQQQSLILLEEVDILFKDDKEFWNTIFKLIQSSKRPFIMTCNDEGLVPLQAMSLHAVLRFSPPPMDLATDYLLLMAANEGHLLKREAVTSLYRAKRHDLRASIAGLNFWCQMGVGDPRVGLSWIFQRYPPGSDVDSEGQKLRVISEGTFERKMSTVIDQSLDEDAQLLWAQQQYNIDPTRILGWDDDDLGEQTSLERFCSAIDALSAADVYSGTSGSYGLDTTQPPMPDKARNHYIEGMRLLQTDQAIEYSAMTRKLATTSTLLAIRNADILSATEVRSRIEHANLLPKHDATRTRHDFACFDAISVPSENILSTGPGLTQSTFDGPLVTVTTDLAPYVRSIARYEIALAEQRERLNSILNDGRHAKRARTTRAARSALEGGQRASTRREKWFSKNLNLEAVLATAGKDWPDSTSVIELTDVAASREGTETPASSANEVRGDP